MEHKQSFFQRIGKDKRYIVFNLFFAYFTLGVALIMLGSVLPVLKAEYALNYQVGGMLLSVQSIGYAVAGLGAGFLPLYLGLKKSFILLTSGTCIGMGMLLASGNPVWLLTAMGLIGISKGAVTNYNNQIMTELAEGDAGPLNLMHAFFAIGACIAPFIVLLCGKVDASGWRLAVFLSAARGAACDVPHENARQHGKTGTKHGKNRRVIRIFQGKNLLDYHAHLLFLSGH